jgi:exopolyphosphatase / guanosine-5'-triphosphate,3'-diphosphate pyrophosphatase
MEEEARGTGPGSARVPSAQRLPGPQRLPWGRRGFPPKHADFASRPDGFARAGRPGTYAALDLGTNNCRLLVARPTDDGFRVVDAFSRIIRLGEGVSLSGVLSEGAIVRALDALSVCRDKMLNRGVTRARLIATEACRAAANGKDFLDRVRDHVGIELEIVDRETEAELAATGCTPLMDPRAESVLLFDIGGGSSELVRLGRSIPSDGGPPVPKIEAWASLPVGVVTLAERHGGIVVDRALFDTMVAEVAVYVERFAAENGGCDGGGEAASAEGANMHMLGTSGTVTTICGVHLGLKRYDRRQVDGCWMNDAQVSAVLEQLLAMSYEQRVANACIGRERADLVLAGCAILEAIRQVFPCARLRIADRGLREGMLVQMMREDGVWNGAPALAE